MEAFFLILANDRVDAPAVASSNSTRDVADGCIPWLVVLLVFSLLIRMHLRSSSPNLQVRILRLLSQPAVETCQHKSLDLCVVGASGMLRKTTHP